MKKKIITSTLALSLSLTSFQASSFIFVLPPVVTDYIKFAKEQYNTLVTQNIYYEKMEKMYEYMEQLGFTKSEEIDKQNEFWVSKIAHSAKKDQTIQNLDVASKSVPAFMPCGSITNTVMLKHIYDDQDQFMEKKNEEFNNISDTADNNNEDAVKLDDLLGDAFDKTKKDNADLFAGGNKDKESDGEATSEEILKDITRAYIGNAGLLMSSNKNVETLDEDQQKAMEGMILLLAPPYQTTEYDKSSIEETPMVQIDEVTEKVKRNIVNQVFNRLLAKRISANGEIYSELGIMSQNVKEVYLNPDNPTNTMVAKIQMSELSNPHVAQRNNAVFMANRIENAVKEYKEALSMENVMATMLLEKINN